MRIIAGKHKGARIDAPPGRAVRPTTDRVREAMFASVHFDLPGSCVLDMFGGSGALGIEAESRGASRVCICEQNRGTARRIRENLKRVGNPESIRLFPEAWQSAVRHMDEKFDFVFMDPPYDSDAYVPALEGLRDAGILKPDALLVLESDRELCLDVPGFQVERVKKYGSVRVTFVRPRKETSS